MTDRAGIIAEKNSYDINDLLEIMSILRSDGGCPWDRQQTHKSIRKNLIEETYEVAEAIDNEDPALMCEELGDVLLQVIFHTRMAEEDGEFDFQSVCDGVCKKLVLRHPHIFGDCCQKAGQAAPDAAGVLENWENIKKAEKHRDTVAEDLDSVAKSLPALVRAQKLAKKAMKAGLWAPESVADADGIAEKLFCLCAEAQIEGYDAEELLSRYSDCFITEMAEMEKNK